MGKPACTLYYYKGKGKRKQFGNDPNQSKGRLGLQELFRFVYTDLRLNAPGKEVQEQADVRHI